MSVIKMCKQNLNTTVIHLCRIQYTSPLRNQNLYYSHRYHVKLTREFIYSPSSYPVAFMELTISNQGLIAEVSDNSFYVIDSGTYVDIIANLDQPYYRVTCEVDCKEIGSVTMKMKAGSHDGTTRLLIPNPTLHSMFGGEMRKMYSYYVDYSTTVNIKLNSKDTFRLSINGDSAIIVGNAIGFAPTNWTLTKGADIIVNTATIGSNYTVATSGIFRGTLVFM